MQSVFREERPEMAAEEVSVIALVENLELAVPRRPPARFARQPGPTATTTTRVVELAIKRQLDAEADEVDGLLNKVNKSNGASDRAERHQSLELLRRLPPGTVLIKQVEENAPKETEEERTTSEETSSERPRKLSQRIRNKKPLEVRRNPMRSASRKEPPIKDGRSTATSSRQRLLAAKRRGTGNPSESTGTGVKRARSTSYMNTRSVTRKLYNVGATYEAPTRRDEMQWKEWPVHGMHERPVYHPQFGLAAEYNGRLFTSFDGEGYREITPEAHQIEIVRVDPRVDSLDGSLQCPPRTTSVRTKLLATPATAPVHAKTDKPRLASLCGYSLRPFDQLQSSFSQSQQQQQLRNLERLQHLENLQRLGSRVRLQSPETYQTKLASGRILSKEMFRNLQNATLAHAQQPPVAAAALAQANNPSKCLILPRAAATPVALPFCGVQTFKNPKGKLFFVRASDAPKKPLLEKPSTITSASQSQSVGVAWAESSLRKRLEGPSIEAARLYTPLNQQRPLQPRQPITSRSFPSIRLAESTGIFRPKAATPRDDSGHADFAARASLADDGHMPEVLDLSKKEPPRQLGEVEDAGAKEDKNVSQTYATDLVRYFQNFGADESMDLFEDSKNLT